MLYRQWIQYFIFPNNQQTCRKKLNMEKHQHCLLKQTEVQSSSWRLKLGPGTTTMSGDETHRLSLDIVLHLDEFLYSHQHALDHVKRVQRWVQSLIGHMNNTVRSSQCSSSMPHWFTFKCNLPTIWNNHWPESGTLLSCLAAPPPLRLQKLQAFLWKHTYMLSERYLSLLSSGLARQNISLVVYYDYNSK